jgi:hypothetical protein
MNCLFSTHFQNIFPALDLMARWKKIQLSRHLKARMQAFFPIQSKRGIKLNHYYWWNIVYSQKDYPYINLEILLKMRDFKGISNACELHVGGRGHLSCTCYAMSERYTVHTTYLFLAALSSFFQSSCRNRTMQHNS